MRRVTVAAVAVLLCLPACGDSAQQAEFDRIALQFRNLEIDAVIRAKLANADAELLDRHRAGDLYSIGGVEVLYFLRAEDKPMYLPIIEAIVEVHRNRPRYVHVQGPQALAGDWRRGTIDDVMAVRERLKL